MANVTAAVDDAASIPITHSPLPPEQFISGKNVTAGVTEISGTRTLTCGVWEHTAGVSTDVEQDEVFVVISGRARVYFEDGRVLNLRPGTVGRLLAGERTRWEVDELIRKVWVMAAEPVSKL